MSKNSLLITTTLIGALLAVPAFADKDKEKSGEGSGHTANHKEHFQQRQQMHMDMMKMMADTMTILRDLNHQPSADEKKRLTDMINRMNEMLAQHKTMDEGAMKSMDHKMGSPKGAGHHDKK